MQILRADPPGTQFGCTAATPMTTHDITAINSRSQSDPQTPRQRERRQALSELLTGLTKALDRHGNTASMRSVFEEVLGRALPVRSVQLHGTGTCWKPRPEPTPGARTIALELPGADSASKGVLEATFAPGTHPSEWDFQMLGLATHIGALVWKSTAAGLSRLAPRRSTARGPNATVRGPSSARRPPSGLCGPRSSG